MTPEAWRDAGEFWDWRGHRMFGRVGGKGEPLLLVHGFPAASWDWDAIWEPLAARYRVLACDLIGFGWSAKPPAFDYTIAAQADVVEAFAARHGVTRCRLLAHDYGVTVAQELLARALTIASPGSDGSNAERCGLSIERVVLLNGGLFPETHRPLIGQRILASRLGPWFARHLDDRRFAASMRKIWGATPLADDELAGMWRLLEVNDGRAVLAKLIGYMAERRKLRARWVDALVHATMPIRLIDGLADPVSGAHMVARYRCLVPNPDVVELRDVGHYPQVEAPEAVLAAALPFLTTSASVRAL